MLKTIRNHHNTKGYFTEFADRVELVYFGDIKQDDDAHIYRGATFSPISKDSHYCHGTVNGYDLTTFSRRSTHTLHTGETTTANWTVIAIHLKTSALPHVVLDAKKHDKIFYDALFTRFPRLRRASEVLNHLNVSASQYFDMYVRPDGSMTSELLLDDMVLERMIMNYSRFNIEIDDNMLYVFKQGDPISAKELRDMLDEGLWLSEKIEYRAAMLQGAALATV